MRSKLYIARSLVLRELSLLRALGASLRTFRPRGRLRGPALPLGILKTEPVAMTSHPTVVPTVQDKRP